MGADLYIKHLFDKRYKEFSPLFDAAVEKRDEAESEMDCMSVWNKNFAKLQQTYDENARLTNHYYEMIYCPPHYFRDSYNCSCSLWTLGLSWWRDISGVISIDGIITPERGKTFLVLIEECEVLQDMIADSLYVKYDNEYKDWNWDYNDWLTYHKNSIAELKDFLGLAIKNNWLIEASL